MIIPDGGGGFNYIPDVPEIIPEDRQSKGDLPTWLIILAGIAFACLFAFVGYLIYLSCYPNPQL